MAPAPWNPQQRNFTLRTARNFETPEQFAQMVVAHGKNNYLVRLGEIAKVEVAADDLNVNSNFTRQWRNRA